MTPVVSGPDSPGLVRGSIPGGNPASDLRKYAFGNAFTWMSGTAPRNLGVAFAFACVRPYGLVSARKLPQKKRSGWPSKEWQIAAMRANQLRSYEARTAESQPADPRRVRSSPVDHCP